MTSDSRCAFGIEQEFQNSVEGRAGGAEVLPTLRRFLSVLRGLAPSLPGPNGFFNGYGRVYVDAGAHLEFASIECDSPFALAQVVETQYGLARKAVKELAREQSNRLLLVNNNHDGLLQPGTPVWGTHENYLVHRSVGGIKVLTLPFLLTRIYGGSGGVLYPTGEFLAGTRPLSMVVAAGRETPGERAILSTSRQEHLMGGDGGRFRLHLTLGDGHRSQFNLALQIGATALTLKAVQTDDGLAEELRSVRLRRTGEDTISALRRLNRLAGPGEAPAVHPTVVKVQRIYLDAARRTVASLPSVDDWMPRILEAWESTLDAFERGDREWLFSRLDAFTKYELYTDYLHQRGWSWTDLEGDKNRFAELALLDHDYHAISEERSAFSDLEAKGLLQHRVADPVEAGSEAEPYVPNVGTRARARARFIREHAERWSDFLLDWDRVADGKGRRMQSLSDPFAQEYTEKQGWSGVPLAEVELMMRQLEVG